MKFLPLLRPVAMLSLIAALDACAISTPANRRELYNTSYAESGPWHDYSRRREAEAQTGISAGTSPSVLPGHDSRPTAPPPSAPVPPPAPTTPAAPAQSVTPDPGATLSSPTAPAAAPAPAPTTPTDAVTQPPPP